MIIEVFMICFSIHNLKSTKINFVPFVLSAFVYSDSNDFDSFLNVLQCVHICESVCCFLGRCQII